MGSPRCSRSARLRPPPGCARGLPAAGGARGRRRCAGGAEEALPPLSVSLSPSPLSRPSCQPRLPLRSRGLTAGTGGGRDRHTARRCPPRHPPPAQGLPRRGGPRCRSAPGAGSRSHPSLPAPRGRRSPPRWSRGVTAPLPRAVVCRAGRGRCQCPGTAAGPDSRRALPGGRSRSVRTKAAGGRARHRRRVRSSPVAP